MASSKNKITKHIVFPAGLVQMVEQKNKKTGISFAEYLRHLILNDIDMEVEFLDKETEASLDVAMKEFQAGQTIKVKNKEELHNFLENL